MRKGKRTGTHKGPPIVPVGQTNVTRLARRYIAASLDNNRLTYGVHSIKMEELFARLHDCKYAVLSNSGTSSLQVAVQALKLVKGWKRDDQIIVPATTFVATLNIVLHNNMNVKLVDVDPEYFCMDPGELADAVGGHTRAVIPVHLCGQPADMAKIKKTADSEGISIVEDSCECILARDHGRLVGSWGDVGCFSTYAAHLLTTGVGGISTTNNKRLAIMMRSLVNHGRDSIYINIDSGRDTTDAGFKMVLAKRFRFQHIGHSFRITELEAALGRAQLEEAPERLILKRQKNAEYLTRNLRDLDDVVQLPKVRPGSTHSFMMYPVVLRRAPKKDITLFLEQNGIETRELLPLINQPVYQKWLVKKRSDYPVSDWLLRSGFYIGCHPHLGRRELDLVIEKFHEYFDRA